MINSTVPAKSALPPFLAADQSETWPHARLADVATEKTTRNSDLRFTRAEVLGVDNQRGLHSSDRVLGETLSRYKVVANGDFAYNPMRLNVGSMGLYRGREPGIVSPDYVVFGCDQERLVPEFLDFFRRTTFWRQQISMSGQGSVRVRYYFRHIATFDIPLPPVVEQRRIVNVLHAVNEGLLAADRMINGLRELKRSLVEHLFKFGPVAPQDAERVDVSSTEIGTLPRSWSTIALGELFEIQQGKALNRKVEGSGQFYPFLRTGNVLWGRIDTTTVDQMRFADRERERFALRTGDLLVCEGGEIGRAAVWEGEIRDCYYQNHIHRLRKRDESVVPRFYGYWLEAALTQFGLYAGVGNRTTIPNLSRSRLASLTVPQPPATIQEAVATSLLGVDRAIAAYEGRASGMRALLVSLTHNLMTGSTRVNEMGALAAAETSS